MSALINDVTAVAQRDWDSSLGDNPWAKRLRHERRVKAALMVLEKHLQPVGKMQPGEDRALAEMEARRVEAALWVAESRVHWLGAHSCGPTISPLLMHHSGVVLRRQSGGGECILSACSKAFMLWRLENHLRSGPCEQALHELVDMTPAPAVKREVIGAMYEHEIMLTRSRFWMRNAHEDSVFDLEWLEKLWVELPREDDVECGYEN